MTISYIYPSNYPLLSKYQIVIHNYLRYYKKCLHIFELLIIFSLCALSQSIDLHPKIFLYIAAKLTFLLVLIDRF